MDTIKSLKAFSEAYDLIEYVIGEPEIESVLSSDEIDYLKHMNDFECFQFFLLNDDFVLVSDGINGDVISENAEGFDDFWKSTVEWVKENA